MASVPSAGMLRFLTAGESHGPGLVTIVEGLPAGLAFDIDGLAAELGRRRLGLGRGPRMALETDHLTVTGGIRHGRTLGSPVAIVVGNAEYEEKWSEEMNPLTGVPRRTLTAPRPGHADLVGMQKYDTHDARNILERASARETAARTVAGYLAKLMLEVVDVAVLSHVVEIGGVTADPDQVPRPEDLDRIDASPVRAFLPESETAMIEAIESARADRDTLGGIVEVVAHEVVPGLGSHVHWDRKLDGLLAGAVMSIQAIKAVEIGDGIQGARRRGSQVHDEILDDRSGGFSRASNRSGGIEGGISTGEPIRVRAAMKPISTVGRGLRTVDVGTREAKAAFYERSDVVAVPAAAVVAEQMVAWVLASELGRKFGADTVVELQRNVESYRSQLARF